PKLWLQSVLERIPSGPDRGIHILPGPGNELHKTTVQLEAQSDLSAEIQRREVTRDFNEHKPVMFLEFAQAPSAPKAVLEVFDAPLGTGFDRFAKQSVRRRLIAMSDQRHDLHDAGRCSMRMQDQLDESDERALIVRANEDTLIQ